MGCPVKWMENMKKSLLFVFLMLFTFLILPVEAEVKSDESAVTVEWSTIFTDAFTDSTLMGWPVGSALENGVSITRSIADGKYSWNVTSPSEQYSFLRIPVPWPNGDTKFRISTSVQMPYLTPYTCTGLVLDGQQTEAGDSFYSFFVCNDASYSLQKCQDGQCTEMIPFTPLKDYIRGQSADIAVEISGGWADLYFGTTLLDTYNISFNNGYAGLIVLPLSADATPVSFGPLTVASTPWNESEERGEISEDVPTDIARILKVLNLKDRIKSVGGSYFTIEDGTFELASIGAQNFIDLDVTATDFIMQTDVSWKSAYDKPNLEDAGCGFFFRSQGSGTYLRAYLSMNGAIYLDAYRNDARIPIISYKYGDISVDGSGTLAVAADTEKISILYNGNLLGTYTSATWMGTGSLGYVVKSGTNLDYGTRCTFSNSQIYILD